VKYLDAFLARAPSVVSVVPQVTKPVLSVLAPGDPVTSAGARAVLAGERPPCSDCGRTDWTVTVVLDDGRRFCARCWA
jgi:hypothetical protein